MRMIGAVLGVALLTVGCKDKAQDDYARCVQADASGDAQIAWLACNAAVRDDPTSTAGKAAAAMLPALKAKLDAWKAQQDAAAAAKAQAAASAQAARVAALRAKVTKKYWDVDPDGECTGKGLPPYRWDYGGGSYAEDQAVATGDGCSKLHASIEIQTYCCPQAPHSLL